MKAKIISGEFRGTEFEISDETLKNIKKNTADPIEEYINNHPFEYDNRRKALKRMSPHILVPLPTANDNWTFAAFCWVKDFCNHFNGEKFNGCKYSAYPVHGPQNDNTNYLYIYYDKN